MMLAQLNSSKNSNPASPSRRQATSQGGRLRPSTNNETYVPTGGRFSPSTCIPRAETLRVTAVSKCSPHLRCAAARSSILGAVRRSAGWATRLRLMSATMSSGSSKVRPASPPRAQSMWAAQRWPLRSSRDARSPAAPSPSPLIATPACEIFRIAHGRGYCTPGMLVTARDIVIRPRQPVSDHISRHRCVDPHAIHLSAAVVRADKLTSA